MVTPKLRCIHFVLLLTAIGGQIRSGAAEFRIDTEPLGVPYIGPGYQSIHSVGENLIWVAADSLSEENAVYRSIDAGASWTRHLIGNEEDFGEIAFGSELVGFAISEDHVARTTDGGLTWESRFVPGRVLDGIQYPSASDYGDVFALNATHAWISFDTNFLRTTDGGATWTELPVFTLGPELFFLNENLGYAAGFFDFWKTTDGGLTWTELPFPDYVLHDLYFLDENRGFGVSVNGALLRTTDGGQSWTVDQLLQTELTELEEMTFVSDEVGFIVADQIYKTTDGGDTWVAKTAIPDMRRFTSIDFTSPTVGRAVGWDGNLATTTDGGETWDVVRLGTPSNIRALHFLDDSRAWSIWNGDLAHTGDAGMTWRLDTPEGSTDTPLRDLTFTPNGTGWLVGSGGKIWKRPADADSWTTTPSGTTKELLKVYFQNDEQGWICGLNGAVLRTVDGGEHWQPLDVESEGRFAKIRFFGENIGWISGLGDLLLTQDGGDTWESVRPAFSQALSDFRVIAKDVVVYILGTQRWITYDSGETWEETDLDLFDLSNGVRYLDDCFGFSYGWHVSVTRDGGRSWSQVDTAFQSTGSAMQFTSHTTGYAATADNALSRFEIVADPENIVGVFETELATGLPISLEFPTEVGKEYIVQFSADMVSWESNCIRILATESATSWTDAAWPGSDADSSRKFYRVLKVDE